MCARHEARSGNDRPMMLMKFATSCSDCIHREGTPSGSSLRYGAKGDADPLLRSKARAMASGMPLRWASIPQISCKQVKACYHAMLLQSAGLNASRLIAGLNGLLSLLHAWRHVTLPARLYLGYPRGMPNAVVALWPRGSYHMGAKHDTLLSRLKGAAIRAPATLKALPLSQGGCAGARQLAYARKPDLAGILHASSML